MGRDVVEESPEDPNAGCPPFETVADAQDPVVDAVSDAFSRLQTTVEKPDPVYRPKRSTKDTHSSVISKLTRVLRVPDLLPEIERICVVMKQMQLEGWHLTNLHVLRFLKEGEEVPELDQMFFYRCCSATLQNHSLSREWKSHDQRDGEVDEDKRVEHDRSTLPPPVAPVHTLPLRARGQARAQVPRRETSCRQLLSHQVCSRERRHGNLTGNTTKAWTQWDDSTDPVELELRAWLGMVPWQWAIRSNSGHFLSKLYDMLKFMEAFAGKHPKQRGARVYSLLPVATSYQAAHVTINASTLFSLLSRVIDQPKVEEWLKSDLKIVRTRKVSNPDQLPFSLRTFQSHKSEVMRSVFSVGQFKTGCRKFVDDVKTNGYAASVTMIRPLTTTSVVVVESTDSTKKRKKTNDGAEPPTREKSPKQKKR
ncbi:hypothetical protein PHYPSEUDO_013552 [Phytophthora pseudosyringae]|uniref:Uncharacterized protein n=1 Tax=Phytophthora pseudosyringae TaxID=221518 RepID=A0A8T1W3K8_9STRA|nr:hypothetical protein PHYPSEUDO_013552 [Phytophthora pseudosyringae]